MSYEREGWKLTIEEIAVILSMVGKEQFVGLAEAQTAQLQPQDLLNACCALLRDRMMTQVDGRYRLSRELAGVMEPVCLAKYVLMLVPGGGRRGIRMFYANRSVTSMEQSNRGFIMTRLEAGELPDELWETMELLPAETMPESAPPAPDVAASKSQLLADASFLLENLDPNTGERCGWLRVRRQALRDVWLEWTEKGVVRQIPLNRRSLTEAIGSMLRGETV